MNVKQLANKAIFQCKKNSPTILAGIAVGGVVVTAVLAAKNHQDAVKVIEEDERTQGALVKGRDRNIHIAKLTWRCYIPAGIVGATTIGCIIGSNRLGLGRTAAVQAALLAVERSYDEYRGKVVEEYGESKDRSIRGDIAKDRVTNSEIPASIISGPGNVLSCELYTGRYFTSDMESLRRAVNDLNSRLISQDMASLQDFYDIIGLQPTQVSDDLGWNSDKMMELEFTTVLTEDGRPCLAFEYNYVRPLYEGLMP